MSPLVVNNGKFEVVLPRFKKMNEHDNFRLPEGIKLDQLNSRIFPPKMDWIRYRSSRMVERLLKNLTISCAGGKCYVSIQTEREVEQSRLPAS